MRRILTFLTTTELTSLATDFSIESLWQSLDKVEDVGISAGSFDLFLSDFAMWLDGTEQDVEFNGTSIQSLVNGKH